VPYVRDETGRGELAFAPLTSEPAGPADVKVGEPLGVGLHAEWIVLDYVADHRYPNTGTVLVVRPHQYHPFLTERLAWNDRGMIVYQGDYHETLREAVGGFKARVAL
jgi:hypothetical protein